MGTQMGTHVGAGHTIIFNFGKIIIVVEEVGVGQIRRRGWVSRDLTRILHAKGEHAKIPILHANGNHADIHMRFRPLFQDLSS